ncbi:capsule biosynthesis protein [Segetibacter sp. 3557_3]|nr:capsule biosynthesis protein [Segetibacter sp. 3557_3]
MKVFARIGFLCVVFLCLFQIAQAQDMFKLKDLSRVNVDALTDEEVLRYRDQFRASGISETQAEQLAIQKGLPSSELLKLKARITKLENLGPGKVTAPPIKRGVDTVLPIRERREEDQDTVKSLIFGSELFRNNNLSFEPNLRIASPRNYTLGPDDEVLIDVYGYQEVNYRLTVSPEGTIVIPYVGVITVSGSTIEQATVRIKDRMSRNGYASLRSGQSKLVINVGKIKSIRVTVVGEAKRPGSYTVSGLSNMFNALYAAGGITDRGSFRTIQLVRSGKVIDTLDAYDFLLRGDLSHNSGLMDQDVILIPVSEALVEVRGEVKRPGIYEILPTENLNDLFRFTGGFGNEAYTAGIHVEQVTDKERQLRDVSKNEFATFNPGRGDIVYVDKILDKFVNRVTIRGAIMRPGAYELTPGLTIGGLIRRAEGLREDALKDRIIILRSREDMTVEYIPVQVNEVLAGRENDLPLRKEDVVTIASVFDFKENYTVTIQGEVRKPGVYRYVDSATLKDLLFEAGGLTDAAAPQQIEIARRLNSDTITANDQRVSQIIEVASERDLRVRGNEVKIAPWDIVIVRTKLGYKPQVTVRLDGEVQYPGIYVLQTKDDRISDIISRAGGLTPQANLQGAYLSRINVSEREKDANIDRVKKVQEMSRDTTDSLVKQVTKPLVKIGLDLDKILKAPHQGEDMMLQEGDVLNVGRHTFEVKINGEVLFPTQVVFRPGADVRYYIDKAGGFAENAVRKRTYVLYANGYAAKTRKFLFFKNYPEVKPGSEILVPLKPERKGGLSTGELIGLTSGLATILTLIITLTR